jgi:hypothetical protein
MTLLKKLLDLFSKNARSDSTEEHQAQFKSTIIAKSVSTTPHQNEGSPAASSVFDVIVVGVSFYQEALAKICDNRYEEGFEMLVQAEIVPEEGNPYDSNAVRIEIGGETVGHLSRQNALKWRGKMKSEGISEAVTCPAKITWDRNAFATGSYGVWLDLNLTLTDSVSVINADEGREDSDFQRFLEGDGIVFLVNNFCIQDTLRVGMSVKLWIPKTKDPDTVYLYDRSSPYGSFGIIPPQYSDIVVPHLMTEMDYDARVAELTYNKCQIKCRLISKEETEHRREESKASLKNELTKPYNPKKPITLMFSMKTKEGAKVGDKLIIEFEDIDSYGPYPCQWHIKFRNQTGDTIGFFSDNRSIIQRILKAHFNSFLFDVEVLDVAKERNIAWKGYPTKLVITPYKSNNGESREVGP